MDRNINDFSCRLVDVLLINLPGYGRDGRNYNSFPPMGLMYIASYLKNKGISVKLIDFNVSHMDKSQFISELLSASPKIVGLSTYNESWNAQKLITQIIRNSLPNSIIVAGGPFANFCYTDIFRETNIDFVIRGEGEFSLYYLYNKLINNKGISLEQIPGLVYRKKDGSLQINKSERIEQLDELPFPDRSLVNMNKYFIGASVTSARGCPGECIYCSSKAFFGKKVIFRSAENLVEEILTIYKNYKINLFHITDDTFTFNRQRVFDFCNMLIDTKIPFDWACLSRADILTDEVVKVLSAAGCRKMAIGLESADNEILKKLKKHITVEQVENAIQLSVKHGITIQISYIIGHAFDTNETIQKTINFVKYLEEKYGVYATSTINTPFPGTEQFEKAEELGIKIHSYDWNDFRLQKPNISIRELSFEELKEYYNSTLRFNNVKS